MHAGPEPAKLGNSMPITALLSGLLILSGIAGVAFGVGMLGFDPQQWRTNTPLAAPVFTNGLLSLLGGIALQVMSRRAVTFLVLGLIAQFVWIALVGFGWNSTGLSLLTIISLVHAHGLLRRGRLNGAAPNNSFKPKPLRDSRAPESHSGGSA